MIQNKKKVFFILLIIFLIFVGVFIFFMGHFKPNTVINYGFNSVNVGLKSVEDAVNLIKDDLYKLNYSFIDINGETYKFNISEVISNIDTDVLEKQLENSIETKKYDIDIQHIFIFDDNSIEKVYNNFISSLSVEIVEPTDAHIVFDSDKKEYTLIKEEMGNILLDTALSKIKNEIQNFNFNINFVDLGCYKIPNIYSNDEILLNNLGLLKDKEKFTLTYLFGDSKEVLDISIWESWVSLNYLDDGRLDEVNTFIVDSEQVKEYVNNLNSKYTTFGKSRTFETSTGKVIEITKGDYGWWLDKNAMVDDILLHFQTMDSAEKNGIFKQEAFCFGESDFKDSYVEVSIDNQRVWMYVNGECIVDTPVVTGNISAGHNTRKGIFSLTYKTRNATLRGADYASFVYYWMPFDGGIGLHDATWRYSFGGNIYKTNGSHGCVNMPLDAAKTVYNNLESNMPIIVW